MSELESDQKDKIIESLKNECGILQNKCMLLTEQIIEFKKKCLPSNDATETWKISEIYSTNINLKNTIVDLKQTAKLLFEEKIMIENTLNTSTQSDDNTQNIIILNDEIEVEDIDSTDDEIVEMEIKQSMSNSLQTDFEIYNIDRFQNINNYNKPLILFHRMENEVIKQWNLLKKQYHKHMFEQLCKINSESIVKIIAYSILFDLLIAVYNFMYDQYKTDSKVIDLILLNIIELSKIDREKYEYFGQYINALIGNVTKTVFERYNGCLNACMNKQLESYAIKCCEIIWNLIHFRYEIYPLEMYFDCNDNNYDENIHEKETNDCNDEIEFCVFPSVRKNGIYKSKILVIYNQE